MAKWQIRVGNPLAGIPGGGVFAPTIVVGNVPAGDPAVAQAAPFEYIPDPGNGSGIATAFATLAAAGTGGWIHIRRGIYDFGALGAPALPLTIAGFRVAGDGCGTLLRMSTLDRRLFLMTTVPAVTGRGPELYDVGVDWTTAALGAVGTEVIDASGSFRAVLSNVEVIKSAGPVLNADESVTSIFRGGILTRFLNCRAQNVDGEAGLGVVAFRLAGPTGECQGCSVTGANVAYRAEATVQGIVGCTSNGAALAASHTGYQIDADNVRVGDCQASSGVDGIVAQAAGGLICMSNNITGMLGDGVRIEAGATDCIVVGNRLNGNSFVDAGTGTEAGHNAP